MLTRRRAITLSALALPGIGMAQEGGGALASRMRAGACAVLWRHAQTEPGVGDPPGFKLAQCSTQRNLSESGRTQARVAGEWFRSRRLVPTVVRASVWCRCKDTADLAFGKHQVWTPLNSTFGAGERGNEAAGVREMRERLGTIGVGRFEVWVTHQVNITALTGEVPSMGEGLVVGADGKVLARGVFA